MKKSNRTQFEFIALMASLMAVVAVAIDAVLPALNIIGKTIHTAQKVDNQFIILSIFIGLAIGPLLFGPLSDAKGRKPMVYIGFAIFTVASIICVLAQSLEVMIIGRALQGIGLSAPRTISTAIIRDIYEGDYMARIMSFVSVIFILVPVVAPVLGKFIMDQYEWQGIFYVQLLIAVLVSIWFYFRQEETLLPKKRKAFKVKNIKAGFREVFQHKITMGYTLIWGLVSGSFMVYLSASQQIFENQYNLEDEFPFIFAGLALTIGAATFVNGTFVLRFGMRKLVTVALFAFFIASITYVILFNSGENPPIEILVLFFGIQFFFIGFLFGNLRALAMDSLGHIAGVTAAITGFIALFIAIPISALIGRFVATSTLPLFIGFSISAGVALPILYFVKRIEKGENFSIIKKAV